MERKNSSDIALLLQPVSPTTLIRFLRLLELSVLRSMKNSALNLGLGSGGGALLGGGGGEGEGEVGGEG